MTDKMREEFEKWATDKGYNIERWIYGRHLYANRLTQNAWEVWQAAQSPAVPVVERNQCDGCNRGLQVCDDGLHREPSGHPVMACTRNKYTHSIPEAEIERLRKDTANAEIGAAVQRAARELPDGYDIFMQIENGSASVQLYSEDTKACMDMDVDADNRLAAEIHAAIDAAIAGDKK